MRSDVQSNSAKVKKEIDSRLQTVDWKPFHSSFLILVYFSFCFSNDGSQDLCW